VPLNSGDTYFESESEMCGWQWNPLNWDLLGRMNIYGAQ